MKTPDSRSLAPPTADPACSLPEEEQGPRIAEVRSGIARRILERRELRDGVALAFPGGGESRRALEEFVAFERRCCSFAAFALRAEEAEDRIWLEIRGGESVRRFVDTLFPHARPAAALHEEAAPERNWLAWSLGGAIASAAALLCCVAGVFPLLAAGFGIAGAGASIGLWVDRIAGPAFLLCAAMVAVTLWRRRRTRSAASASTAGACGCSSETAASGGSALPSDART